MSTKVKYRRILSPSEIEEVVESLDRLARIYEALGLPEDAEHYRIMIWKLKQ